MSCTIASTSPGKLTARLKPEPKCDADHFLRVAPDDFPLLWEPEEFDSVDQICGLHYTGCWCDLTSTVNARLRCDHDPLLGFTELFRAACESSCACRSQLRDWFPDTNKDPRLDPPSHPDSGQPIVVKPNVTPPLAAPPALPAPRIPSPRRPLPLRLHKPLE